MATKKRAKPNIDLRNMGAIGPLFAEHARHHYGTCASFCFRRKRPRGPIELSIVTENGPRAILVGVYPITKAIRATLGDDDDAVEHGAYAVALLTAARELGMRFDRRSFKGTGFDFYVTPPGRPRPHPDDIFGDIWGFEVTGLMEADRGAIKSRLKRKRLQVSPATKIHPVLIAVVEFSVPVAIFELQEKQP
jgi:hypothetical protein